MALRRESVPKTGSAYSMSRTSITPQRSHGGTKAEPVAVGGRSETPTTAPQAECGTRSSGSRMQRWHHMFPRSVSQFGAGVSGDPSTSRHGSSTKGYTWTETTSTVGPPPDGGGGGSTTIGEVRIESGSAASNRVLGVVLVPAVLATAGNSVITQGLSSHALLQGFPPTSPSKQFAAALSPGPVVTSLDMLALPPYSGFGL
mmetsp:Transcript_2696/g.6290  ORF Transcript_2696/g.6290 Transcript_2696/m.6290 type:complete len:201 (+) Transcript_2696:935-1537(+)